MSLNGWMVSGHPVDELVDGLGLGTGGRWRLRARGRVVRRSGGRALTLGRASGEHRLLRRAPGQRIEEVVELASGECEQTPDQRRRSGFGRRISRKRVQHQVDHARHEVDRRGQQIPAAAGAGVVVGDGNVLCRLRGHHRRQIHRSGSSESTRIDEHARRRRSRGWSRPGSGSDWAVRVDEGVPDCAAVGDADRGSTRGCRRLCDPVSSSRTSGSSVRNLRSLRWAPRSRTASGSSVSVAEISSVDSSAGSGGSSVGVDLAYHRAGVGLSTHLPGFHDSRCRFRRRRGYVCGGGW